jgi:hypothetical protein
MEAIEKDQFREIFPFFSNAPQILVENILSSSRYKKIPRKVRGGSVPGFHFHAFWRKKNFQDERIRPGDNPV